MGSAYDFVTGRYSRQSGLRLFGCGFPPQQEDDAIIIFWVGGAARIIVIAIHFGGCACAAAIHRTNDFVRKFFPAFFLVAVGLPLSNRQDVVDHQDSLFCPAFQIPVARNRNELLNPGIVVQLLVYIPERRWDFDPLAHRKTKPVGLPLSVVRILPDNDEFYLREWTQVQCRKGIFHRWEYGVLLPFRVDERRESSKGGRRKMFAESNTPGQRWVGRQVVANRRNVVLQVRDQLQCCCGSRQSTLPVVVRRLLLFGWFDPRRRRLRTVVVVLLLLGSSVSLRLEEGCDHGGRQSYNTVCIVGG